MEQQPFCLPSIQDMLKGVAVKEVDVANKQLKIQDTLVTLEPPLSVLQHLPQSSLEGNKISSRPIPHLESKLSPSYQNIPAETKALLNQRPTESSKHQRSSSLNQDPSRPTVRHQRSISDPIKRYICFECLKSFSRPSSLKVHVFSHTKEKPVFCPVPGCRKRFSVSSNMRRHLKINHARR